MLELSYRGERLMNELALHSEVGSNGADVRGFPNDNLILAGLPGEGWLLLHADEWQPSL